LEPLIGAPSALILDVPCGTGVYSSAFREKGYDVVAADASSSMLEVTDQRAPGTVRVQCDIGRLPFRESAFDAVLTIRLLSHCPREEVAGILVELKRAIRPDGRVVFDTFRWSPRKWPLLRRFLEESYIYVMSHNEVQEAITHSGLTKVDSHSLHLFSPLWQRKLPWWLLQGLVALERLLPQRWLLRTLWACTRD
jgi:ubiquinone/menaquinone biosynthesis C-methylase UbiE